MVCRGGGKVYAMKLNRQFCHIFSEEIKIVKTFTDRFYCTVLEVRQRLSFVRPVRFTSAFRRGSLPHVDACL